MRKLIGKKIGIELIESKPHLVEVMNGNIEVVKESQSEKRNSEYQIRLVIDTMLNIGS